MRQYLPFFRQSLLFDRIDDEGLVKTLNCLNVQVVACERGKIIFHQGDAPRFFGVVLQGSVQVLSNDLSGNHSILWTIQQGELFAETYASTELEILPASFVAAQDSLIMILEYNRVINGCRNNGCQAHSCLITNLLRSIAGKNLMLLEKMEFITQRTTRDKLMAYLLAHQKRAKTARFEIPFDRQGLADYLGVERSAMSAEMSRMKKDGLIDYRKNEFEILNSGHAGVQRE